jgi:hypothetical protein
MFTHVVNPNREVRAIGGPDEDSASAGSPRDLDL